MNTAQRYYSFNTYLKKRFGERVHRLSVNPGFGCPNCDGTLSHTGCVFCNNAAFTWEQGGNPVSLDEQISLSAQRVRRRFHANKFILYFQAHTGTYAPPDRLKEVYSVIDRHPDIVGLCVSTRPDCAGEETLEVLASFLPRYEVFVEYGLQSMHDETLRRIHRNHTCADFVRAVRRSAEMGLHAGAHVILGLPGETSREMCETARLLSELPLWGVKFHALHVVRGTELEREWEKNEVSLLTEDEYIDHLIRCLEYLPEETVILRLISDAKKPYLRAPAWLNQKPRVLRKFRSELERRNTRQGRLLAGERK
ncbi:MAG: TIGR01212 family radical SAM protein [Candidatus Omnitrophica bacterium]|nr:TIGR01212 family radical SAM protein [Candidatus Omnitrophota bacterium]